MPHQFTCQKCGRLFAAKLSRQRLYCSKRCYGDAKILRVDRSCLVCGTTRAVRRDTIALGYGSYCSKACSNRARAIPRAERHAALVDRSNPDGCWPWMAATDVDGYGLFFDDGRLQRFAHRVAWELACGPIPLGLMVCHHCDNPPCCRPDHLFIGTAADNNADMIAKGRARYRGPL